MSDDINDTKCSKCNLNFTNAKTLKIHQLEKHSQGVVKCFKCGLKFSNQERFRVHWNVKHVTAPKTLTEPKPTASNEETVNLDEDSESSSQKADVTTKKRKIIGPTSTRCKVCYKAFGSHSSAKLHYERVHLDWTTECEVCKKRVKKNLYIKVHLAKHRLRDEISVERILEIQKENQEKYRKKKPSNEFKVKVQPNVATTCPDCQKVFISDRVMKIHWARVHYVTAPKPGADSTKQIDEANDSEAPKKEPKACPQCNKVLDTDGRMRIHYYQAHVKKAVSKPIRQKVETVTKEKAACRTLPSLKSVSDLRSKLPDIDIDSNTCPACKKVFQNKSAATKHYKVVHRHEGMVKCPYPQCFSRLTTIGNLRKHFSNSHPNAKLPKEFEKVRIFAKKQMVVDKDTNDGDKSKKETTNKSEDTSSQSLQEGAKKPVNETKITKPDNPLLKMFAKMREKNAQSPVAPVKIASEVIEIEEDQGDDNGGCFTLDFEHCTVCNKKFVTQEAAMMHYNNKHSDELQMCSECGMLITNSRKMVYHFKTKHPTCVMPLHMKSTRSIGFTKELYDQFNVKQCTTCQLVFDAKVDSQQHFIDAHDIKFELCSICMRSFRSEATLLTHWAYSHTDSKFVEFKGQTPMEVDENSAESVTESIIENTTENSPENITEIVLKNASENANKADDIPITDSNTVTSDIPVTAKNTPKSRRSIPRIYPFIKSNVCPSCNKQFSTRKSTVMHYKTIHLKNGIECKICIALFAHVDHLKEHWLLVHKNAPWNEPNDEKEEEKAKSPIEDESLNMETDLNKEKLLDVAPKMSVIVSLVNLKDDLDSLSPEIRKQVLELSNELDKTTIDPTDSEEKVSDSGHGSTADTIDEDISTDSSQNEPLDLSVQHNRSPTDDLPDPLTLVKCETISIKYESPADLISSFDDAISSEHSEKSNLADGSDIIVKDEITIEEHMPEQ